MTVLGMAARLGEAPVRALFWYLAPAHMYCARWLSLHVLFAYGPPSRCFHHEAWLPRSTARPAAFFQIVTNQS